MTADMFVDGFFEQVLGIKHTADASHEPYDFLHIHPDRIRPFMLYGIPVIIDSTLEPGEIRLQSARAIATAPDDAGAK